MKTNITLISMIFRGVTALVVGTLVSSPVLAQAPNTLPTTSHPKVKEIISVQESVTDELMATDGILGTAVGLNERGEPALVIYVNSEHKNMADIVSGIPKSMGGRPVKVEVTEPFRSMIKAVPSGTPSFSTVSHKAKQTPPIKLGTSGGWSKDLANGYCCGGTLGSLVQINGAKYILSNYHVLESDIVLGGNNTVATLGDSVIQPGLIDAVCKVENAQSVSSTSEIKSLPTASNVDAAIALVTASMVSDSGEILEIGKISSSTIAASINQAVKKSGRTTGLTKSLISGLNAKVSVTYDNECAGGTAFTKTFTGQIIIKNRGSAFLNSGDSGSLMVQDTATNPKAVGLLFAGSNTLAVANPIDEVLSFFSATMVGQ